ncbi:MAG: Ig-like domain-containing protein, partial [Pseudomonadota bacterium]|nr:Ig-like domain-containing protein [Pseudomonadota bacterium]
MKVQIKVNDVSKTLARFEVEAGDGAKGKGLRLQAQKQVRYELINEETSFAPENIATKRVGNDLHIAFEGSDIAQPDVVIQDYYGDPGAASIIGQAENGLYYNYVPESGLQHEAISRLGDNMLAGQALGGEKFLTALWLPMTSMAPLVMLGSGLLVGGAAIGGGRKTPPPPSSEDVTPPGAPNVVAKADGSVTITPPSDPDVKSVDITYTPEGSNTPKTVTVTKGDNGTWSSPDPNVKVNPTTGVVTIADDKVKDGTPVTANATDTSGNTGPSDTDTAQDATAPGAPDVVANGDGSVTITPPSDPDVKSVDITYTPEGSNTPKTVTVTKGDNGTWSSPDPNVKVNPTTGVVTIADDKVKDGTPVTANATDTSGNTGPSDTETALSPPAAPTLTVVAPDDINDSTPTISGTTDAPAGSTVTITVTQGGTTQTLTTTVQPDGSYSADVPTALSDGAYTVTASVTHNDQTSTASDPGSIDTTPPTLTVAAPDNSTDTTPTISGTTDAPAGSTVTITVTQGGTTQTLTATVQPDGSYSAEVPTPLTDGPYTATASVKDPAGNTTTVNDGGSIDTAAPSITVVAPDNSNDNTPTISGTTSAPVGSTITITITDSAGVTQTVSTTVQAGGTYTVDVPNPVADGPYTATATVTDNGRPGSGQDTGSIDTTPPTLTVAAPDNSNDTTPTITGTTDAPTGSTVTITVTQGGATQTLTATVQPDGSYSAEVPTPLTDGPYTATASVKDPAGNTTTVNDGGSIDTAAPSITVVAPDNSNDNTPTISGTTSAPVGSTITITITDSAGVTQTVSTTVQAGGTYTVDVPNPVADGTYTATATVTDNGRQGSGQDTGSIDTTAPTIITRAPDNSNDTTPTITGTTDAPVGSTVTITVTQGGTTQTLTATVQPDGSYSAEVTTPLAVGAYVATASVTDAAGNTGSSSDPGSVLMLPAPTLTVVAPDDINDSTPTIGGTTDAPAGSTVTITVTQGGTTQTLTATVQPDGSYSADVPTALSDGAYTVTASVTHNDQTSTASDPGSIDTTPPTLTVAAPDNSTDTTPTISGTTDAPAGSTVTITVTQGGTTQTLTATVQPDGSYSAEVPTPLTDGPYTATASVKDPAGNTTTVNDGGSIDTAAPSITVVAPDNSNDNTPTISGTTSAPVGSTITITITDSAGVTQTVSTTVQAGGTYTVDVPNPVADGPYTATATVTDNGRPGSGQDTGSIDTTPPTLTVAAPDNSNDTTPTITGTTDAPTGSTVTITVTQGGATQTLTATVQPDGSYSAEVPTPLTDGPYTATASVKDPAGNTTTVNDGGSIDTAAPSITVVAPDNSNDNTPTISGTTSAPVGSTITITITDSAGVTQTVSTTVQAGGTYTVDVPNPVADGTYTATATVTDNGRQGSGQDTGSIDTTAPTIITRAPDNSNDTTPTITGTTDAPVGSTVTITVTQGGTTQTLTATVQPDGSYSAEVTTPLAVGAYVATASVTDAAGNTGSSSDPGSVLMLPAPTLTVVAPDDINDSTPTIGGTTDAPAGSTVTITVTQGGTTQTLTATVQPDGSYSADVPTALS